MLRSPRLRLLVGALAVGVAGCSSGSGVSTDRAETGAEAGAPITPATEAPPSEPTDPPDTDSSEPSAEPADPPTLEWQEFAENL